MRFGSTEDQRIGNASNKYQGAYKKVLCVCSGGLLRSPTAALVLSQEPFNYNTRSCGVVAEYALTKLDEVLIYWCDEIVVMEEFHSKAVQNMMKPLGTLGLRPVITLDIKDIYSYRDPELRELIVRKYQTQRGFK